MKTVLLCALVVSIGSTGWASPDRTVPHTLAFSTPILDSAPLDGSSNEATPLPATIELSTPDLPSRTWRTVDYATIVVSTAALVADWGQTACTAYKGWGFTHEVNPLMGSERPSVAAVTTYSAVVIALNLVAWKVLPPKWRSVIPSGVIAVQSYAVFSNMTNRWVPSGCSL
jgi:hypothetical protein